MSEGQLDVKDSPYVLGIDLGTCTSICAVYRRGRGEVVKIFGQNAVDSVVTYREDADPLVGLQAKRRAQVNPETTVVSIKRHMGDPDYNREINGTPVKPEQVSAFILEHLKNGAQEHEDLEGTVKYAIVTVPANFNHVQREATLEAGRLAGLEVLRLIDEPVAAAVAYGFGHERDQTILVYDLGGGTFDVCVLKVEAAEGANASFKVLGKAGIPKLGGDDFDEKIMEMLAQKIVEDGGPDILNLDKDQGISKKKLRVARQVLKEKAEAAKIELADAETVSVDVPSLIKDENGKEYHLSTEITRAAFEEAIEPLVKESGEAIQQALSEAREALKKAAQDAQMNPEEVDFSVDDVDRIILVGNSTRTPCVRRQVTDILGKEPYGDIDPGTAVSIGASIIGTTFDLPGERAEGDNLEGTFEETNTTGHYLGIETQGRNFSAVIQKGEQIPCNNKKTYETGHDNQEHLRIAVFQFPKKTEAIDMTMEGSACLGEFLLGPLDPKPAGDVKVEVAFSFDENGVLKVSAESEDKEGLSKTLEVRIN